MYKREKYSLGNGYCLTTDIINGIIVENSAVNWILPEMIG